MAEVKIKTKGSTLDTLEVTATNFSTEETLLVLTQQFKDFFAIYKSGKAPDGTDKRPTGSSGGGSGGSAGVLAALGLGAVGNGAIFDKLVEGAGLAGIEIEVLVKSLEVLEFGINTAISVITGLFATAGNLAFTFAKGETAMSSYVDAVARGTAHIPVLGEFFAVIAGGMDLLEEWNQTLFEMNTMGASFNGNITTMIASAAHAGLTLEQYSKVIQANIATFGRYGSVQQGIDIYTRVAQAARSKEFIGQIEDMGMTIQQFSEGLPVVLSTFGASILGRAKTSDLVAASISLTQQFNEMARVTGKTREQLASDTQKEMDDAAWARMVSRLNTSEATKFTTALVGMKEGVSSSYAELYKLSVLGIPPLTTELQQLLASTPGLTTEFQRMTNLVHSNLAPGSEDYKKQMDKINADILQSGLQAGQSFDTLINAASAGLSGFSKTQADLQSELIRNAGLYYQNGRLNEAAFLAERERLRRRGDAEDGIQKSLNTFNTGMTNLRDNFMSNVVVPFLRQIAPGIESITMAFSKNSGPLAGVLDEVSKAFNQFGTWIADPKNFATMEDDFSKFIKVVAEILKDTAKTVVWVADHWKLVGTIVTAMAAAALVISGIFTVGGVLWTIGKILSIGKTLGGFGGAAEGAAEGAATVGTAAEAGGVAAGAGGLAAEGGLLAGVGGAEAAGAALDATGVLAPLGIALGLGAAGYAAYKLWKGHQEKENAKPSTGATPAAAQPNTTDAMAGMVTEMQTHNELLRYHARLLEEVAANTDRIGRSNEKIVQHTS